MSNKKVLSAAKELSDAAGRVINSKGLSNLEKAIAELSVCLVKYDRAVEESNNEKKDS